MRNGGEWTDARFRSFIKGGLRSISNRWPPKSRVFKKAWIDRGVYLCAGWGCSAHQVPLSMQKSEGSARIRNVFVDHIRPVVETSGFDTWDSVIDNLFCEEDGLQVLCKACHDLKTKEERVKRKEYKSE